MVDPGTYNGFRRYHSVCNHCRRPNGLDSTVAISLVGRLTDPGRVRQIVRHGVAKGTAEMKGFADDPNIAPYIEDIYDYLRARADGALARGRPIRRGK